MVHHKRQAKNNLLFIVNKSDVSSVLLVVDFRALLAAGVDVLLGNSVDREQTKAGVV